jgi:hypothetical protein
MQVSTEGRIKSLQSKLKSGVRLRLYFDGVARIAAPSKQHTRPTERPLQSTANQQNRVHKTICCYVSMSY